MPSRKKPLSSEAKARMQHELRRDAALRQGGYRERALKIFPHLCANCGREFEGRRLRELTVHHKDHDHNNNPPDGSNWELLCLYCHDHEHDKYMTARQYGGGTRSADTSSPGVFQPFAGLDELIQPDEDTLDEPEAGA